MTQNRCGGEHELEQMSKAEGNAVGRADMADEGQGDTADAISHPQSNYGSGNKDIMICAEPCGNIKMPPSSISVVALIGERSFETINIPLDVQSDYGQIGPEIKFVIGRTYLLFGAVFMVVCYIDILMCFASITTLRNK
jgi:hypothetical protein